MSAAGTLLRRALPRLPGATARQRLTLLYAGLFLLLGILVVVAIFTFTSASSSVAVSAVPATRQGVVRPIFHDIVTQQRSADINRLRAVSWVALIAAALVAGALGWLVAGRVLRPLRQMTATARTISAGNLSERLVVAGPDDEFKRLGDTLNDLLGRLEASFEAQRRFVANASHELRTPLTVERTLLQVALADPKATVATLRATCEELLASGREQERMLEALLTLTSSERGLDRAEALDLAVFAERALGAQQPAIAERGITVTRALDPGPVAGDGALLERLVANLVENAVAYNAPSGWIEVATAADPAGSRLTVANAGPAVSASDIERLFEPFQRLGGRHGGADGHHGLGLSIVRAIAVAHRAEVSATPRREGGLTVSVLFPEV